MLLASAIAGAAAWGAHDDESERTDLPQLTRFAPLHAYDPGRAYYPDERWQRVVRPELMGWSSERLAEARSFSETLETSAVVIVENGVVIDAWGDLSKRYQIRSMRKSFLSILFGLPRAEGKIRLSATLEELGIDDVPPLTSEERKATVADLLTSRSGVYHPANYETPNMRRNRPERGSHPPGAFWFYNNWDFNALGSIFEDATGESVFEMFRKHIAIPLQMQDYRPGDTRYNEGKDSIHPAYLFRMSPLDLARLGLLCLNDGRWQGRQIIPTEWIEESTRPHVNIGRRGFSAGYGYMWWVGDDGFAAYGKDGQRLYVMPKRNLVVVHLVDSDERDKDVEGDEIRDLLRKILAAREMVRTDAAGRRGTSHKSISIL